VTLFASTIIGAYSGGEPGSQLISLKNRFATATVIITVMGKEMSNATILCHKAR
jgi:hypothetical protein